MASTTVVRGTSTVSVNPTSELTMSKVNELLDNTDEQTRAYVQTAKSMIASNHGLVLDRDPAEVMRENNKSLHEAAKIIKKKKGMVRQRIAGQPQTPVQQSVHPAVAPDVQNAPLTDENMAAHGYDRYMESMMAGSVQRPDISLSQQPEYIPPEDSYVEVQSEPKQTEVPEPMPQQQVQVQQQPRIELSGFTPRPYVQNQQPQQTVQQVQPVVPPTAPVRNTVPSKPVSQQLATDPFGVGPTQYNFAGSQPRTVVPQQVHDYEAFSEIRGLPSTGVLYGNPISGQAFKLMDLLMLNDIDSENITKVFNELYARRLRGVEPENILSCDDPYILHWLRASSFPDQQLPGVIWFECPECGTRNEAPKNSNGFSVSFYNLDFTIVGDVNAILAKHANGYYAFRLPDGRECDVYLRRRYHDRMVDEAVNAYQRDIGKPMPSYLREIIKSAVVLEIEDCETLNDKINYLSNMNVAAATKMFEEINSASLTTIITAKLTCPKCGKEVRVSYPFRLDQYISSL